MKNTILVLSKKVGRFGNNISQLLNIIYCSIKLDLPIDITKLYFMYKIIETVLK